MRGGDVRGGDVRDDDVRDDGWDVPTAASPVIARSVFPLPPPYVPPLDSSLEGVTEVLSAHPLGLDAPEDEGLGTSDIDVLFGDSKFVEYSGTGLPVTPPTTALPPPYVPPAIAAPTSASPTTDQPTTVLPPMSRLPGPEAPAATVAIPPRTLPPISSLSFDAFPPLPPSALALYERPSTPVTPTMPRTQKILIGVAVGLVAALALVALFLLGMRIGETPSTTANTIPSSQPGTAPSTAPSEPPAVAAGPVAVGDHSWDELLGGECLTLYESPWQDTYTVVDCGEEHPAQMLAKGVLPDAATVAYPGTADLQARTTLACTAPTVIDFAAAGAYNDIEVAASFPATAEQWDAGDRGYYCFASRSGGGDLTGSIATPAP